MNIEKQLITKSYYQSFVDESLEGHPIEQLGELFFKEQKKEMPDASYIRYAQGEVYFLNKDYEAAIFKWENEIGRASCRERVEIAEVTGWLSKDRMAVQIRIG